MADRVFESFRHRSAVNRNIQAEASKDEYRSKEFAAALYELKRQLFSVPKQVLKTNRRR